MDKRQFLQLSGTLLTGSAVSRVASAFNTDADRTNWSGNYHYQAQRLQAPGDSSELCKQLTASSRIKALGARHSFNNIADTSGDQFSAEHFTDCQLNKESRSLVIGSGLKYGQFAPEIDKQGYAVHNLASLPHISVAGACATGTHGSGLKNGNLSTAVRGMEFVTVDGQTVKLSKDKDGATFEGAVVHLGALGVVTRLSLDVQPSFSVAQAVYQNLSFNQLDDHLHDIFEAGYSVSLFSDWQQHRATQVWVKRKIEAGTQPAFAPEMYGARLATTKLHPLAGHSAENCTEQEGIPGPWYERLPHFRMNFTPSSGAELQTEYFVPLEKGYEAILAVEKLKDQIAPHLFISEFRTIDADNLWMSPAYKRRSMAIHFTWKPEWPAVKNILPAIEKQLEPFQPRPHWAKLFTMDPKLIQSRYEKLPEFKRLMRQYDPKGKLRNDYLNRNLFA